MSLDLDAMRDTLEAELGSLESELATLTAVTREPTATIGFGKRVGEGTSEAIGRIERVGQADALSAKLAGVRRALEKFEDGTYGICDRCGATIPDERLEARPSSVRCVRCSAAVP
ncbi:MAG TPA: TraR/DksA C4-type zinc finger protein [Actinomycetota bacterium]|nr:TraR/DksA C4-type zinc finger protein [Actinomycetota bacterium]